MGNLEKIVDVSQLVGTKGKKDITISVESIYDNELNFQGYTVNVGGSYFDSSNWGTSSDIGLGGQFSSLEDALQHAEIIYKDAKVKGFKFHTRGMGLETVIREKRSRPVENVSTRSNLRRPQKTTDIEQSDSSANSKDAHPIDSSNLEKPKTEGLKNAPDGESSVSSENSNPHDKAVAVEAQQELPADDDLGGWLDLWIKSKFEPGKKGVDQLKKRLEEKTADGMNPLVGAYLATQLDLLKFSMDIAEGIPLGFLDVRNIGEGAAQGGWKGYKADAQRALSVIPQGKLLARLDHMLTAADAAEAFGEGKFKEGFTATAVGGATKIRVTPKIRLKKGGKSKNKKKSPSEPQSKRPPSLPGNPLNDMQTSIATHSKDVMGRMEMVESAFKGDKNAGLIRSRQRTESAASTALHETVGAVKKNGVDSYSSLERMIKREFPGEGLRVIPEATFSSKSKANIDVMITKFGKPYMRIELKRTAKFSKSKGKWHSGRGKQKKLFEKSAQKNPKVPHLIVTPEGVYIYKQNSWATIDSLSN